MKDIYGDNIIIEFANGNLYISDSEYEITVTPPTARRIAAAILAAAEQAEAHDE
jgi:penicillin V acylase-like amidase (Ntn superfamily)